MPKFLFICLEGMAVLVSIGCSSAPEPTPTSTHLLTEDEIRSLFRAYSQDRPYPDVSPQLASQLTCWNYAGGGDALIIRVKRERIDTTAESYEPSPLDATIPPKVAQLTPSFSQGVVLRLIPGQWHIEHAVGTVAT